MVQLNEREQKDTNDHNSTTSIVWVGSWDEPIVLCMLKWTDRYLIRAEKMSIADSFVINIKLEDSIYVWNDEFCF